MQSQPTHHFLPIYQQYSALYTRVQSASCTPFPNGKPFQIKSSSSVRHIYLSPTGSDNASGSSRTPWRSVSKALGSITRSRTLTQTYHIHMARGSYSLPEWIENLWGGCTTPIIIEADQGKGSVTLPNIELFNVRNVFFIGIKFQRDGGDVFHCAQCTNVLLRDCIVLGDREGGQETVKVNQSKGFYIENSDISGAWDNAVDFVAVQKGHILNSKIHNANWCVYLKGGSAYFMVANNEVYDCGESGIAAGQGTGFEFMKKPWLRYEAYDIKFVNNFIYNVWGAGLGSWGGHNILFAYNTLYRVGQRSHLLEVKFGERGCDGSNSQCTARANAGGWGPKTVGQGVVNIPNKGVWFLNNLIYNPPGYQSEWQHLQIDGPLRSNCGAGCTLPSTVKSDEGLVFRGNIIWNGPADHSLGLGDGSGCLPSHPTCSESKIRAQNAINTINPRLSGPKTAPSSAVIDAFRSKLLTSLPSWSSWNGVLKEPRGNLGNGVTTDALKRTRTASNNKPGALL